jgi:putative ABC transport system permease protein
MMVNSSFAARYGPSSGVGAQLRNSAGVLANVAGVVGDSREFGMAREPVPTVYICRLAYANPALAFLVRTRGEPTAVAQAVRAKVKELEPLRAVWDVVPLAERLGDEQAQDRLRTLALTLFAGTALALACLGIYGTLSYVVSLRRREVGLRVALGALQGNIVAQFLGRALRVVGVGCAIGVALSFASARLLSGMLFGVSPSDPLTLVSVLALVTAVATLAALVPALRASRVPPMEVLREE